MNFSSLKRELPPTPLPDLGALLIAYQVGLKLDLW